MTGLELLPLAGIALLFWLLILRPASRRARDQQQLQSALAVGDDVMLTSGFFCTITALHDDRVEVELAPGVTVSVVRGAVASVVAPESTDEPTPPHPNQTDVEPPEATDAEEN